MNKNFKNMIIIFAGFFFLSLFSNTLSPFITTIKNTYHVSSGIIAVLPSVVYCASFIMSMVSAKFMYTLGLRKGLNLGFLFAIIASVIIILSKSFYVLMVGYFISGFAVGMGTVFLTTMLSLLPKQYQKFSLANAFFGLGGILILPIDRLILKGNIHFSYAYIVHIILIGIFLVLATRIKGISLCVDEGSECKKPESSVLKNPLVLLFVIAVFFYVGAEISTTNWTGTFLENYYGINKTEVPNILLGFWILFTFGRAIGDKFLNKVGQLRFLLVSPIISICGIFIILFGNSRIQALIGIAILGITMSMIYPAIQGYIIQHVSREDVPPASALITVFNNLGATFLTYIIGFAGGQKVTYVFIIQIVFYLYIIFVAARYLILKPRQQQQRQLN
ncbi:MFS transporter [Clostridium tyrobutyricum]|jgi:fucose permease|nr:MFS transporter [Clostridium tyrobutyricum]MBR9647477.1 MFS transporter [Clostridium tyrobutyricum]MBV4414754.1 MFS transporter [Clostridium tyrobutyricum]MBV4422359.1 MFS transporter [Clostridium tyrobutyricum]MBV4425260.1 MFS transporter [Clostridium tyrobutyricum]MBV4432545.1 MFS transporter [Clostridium tyrobutyricum]